MSDRSGPVLLTWYTATRGQQAKRYPSEEEAYQALASLWREPGVEEVTLRWPGTQEKPITYHRPRSAPSRGPMARELPRCEVCEQELPEEPQRSRAPSEAIGRGTCPWCGQPYQMTREALARYQRAYSAAWGV